MIAKNVTIAGDTIELKMAKARHTHNRNNMIILTLAIVVFLFEQSPANEAVRALVGFQVLDITSSPLYVGLSVLLITLCVEMLTTVFISLGIHHSKRFYKFAASHRNVLRSKGSVSMSVVSNGILALAVGSGIVVIKYCLQKPKATLQMAIKTGAQASVWIAAVSGAIAYLASGGVEVARAQGYGAAADLIVKYGSNWRFWFVLLLASQLIELIMVRSKKKS